MPKDTSGAGSDSRAPTRAGINTKNTGSGEPGRAENSAGEVTETTGTIGTDRNDAGVGSASEMHNTTDESSELSDLLDDSEAETDQMDFLEDGDQLKKLDLRALSDLTQLARLQGVDSDEDDEHREENSGLSDDAAILLNPKENEEASREIAKDIDAIHEELGQSVRENRARLDGRAAKRQRTGGEERDGDDAGDRRSDQGVKEEVSERHGLTGDELEKETNMESDKDGEMETGVETGPETGVETGLDEAADGDEEEAAETGPPDGEDGDAGDENEEEEPEEEDSVMAEKRQAAVAELIEIETAFATLRDKMYHDKLNLLEHELQLCVEGSHPELSKVYYKINAFHQDALRQANSNLSYRLKCIDRETVATRTSVHQNFLKQVYDTKSDMITSTTSKWYKINRERNQLDQLVPDYSYSAEGGAGESELEAAGLSLLYGLVNQRNAINQQLGILDGLVEFSGIPAAVSSSMNSEKILPELLLRKATEEEATADLTAMGAR